MNGIDIVALYDVADDGADIADALRIAWIHVELLAVADEELGRLLSSVVRRQISLGIARTTIGIDPSVEFHTAGVALVDDEAQRVPRGVGRFALLTGEVLTPGLVGALVEGITLSAHLEDNRVAAQTVEECDTIAEELTCLFARERSVIAAVDRREPSAAELTLHWLLGVGGTALSGAHTARSEEPQRGKGREKKGGATCTKR